MPKTLTDQFVEIFGKMILRKVQNLEIDEMWMMMSNFMSGGNQSAELLEEVQALRAEVEELRQMVESPVDYQVKKLKSTQLEQEFFGMQEEPDAFYEEKQTDGRTTESNEDGEDPWRNGRQTEQRTSPPKIKNSSRSRGTDQSGWDNPTGSEEGIPSDGPKDLSEILDEHFDPEKLSNTKDLS